MNTIISNAFSKDVQNAYCPMTRDEEYECIRKAKEGDNRAQNKLVSAQLKRIVAIARSYSSHINSVEELTSEGTLGLVKAIESFDFDKADGMRFHSYAQWWVREHIANVVYDNQLMRLPRSQTKGKKEVRDENGKIIEEKKEGARVNSLSINSPIGNTGRDSVIGSAAQLTLENYIPDEKALSADTLVEYTKMMSKLSEGLTEHELNMFEARIFDEYTYEEIGKLFDINTREGARQHVEKVLVKARKICNK